MQMPVDAHTAVLLLFHDHEWEQNLLMHAATLEPFFIGALRSRKTQEIRLQRLADAGLSAAYCARPRPDRPRPLLAERLADRGTRPRGSHRKPARGAN